MPSLLRLLPLLVVSVAQPASSQPAAGGTRATDSLLLRDAGEVDGRGGRDARLYDGSWDEWSRLSELPIETGPR